MRGLINKIRIGLEKPLDHNVNTMIGSMPSKSAKLLNARMKVAMGKPLTFSEFVILCVGGFR